MIRQINFIAILSLLFTTFACVKNDLPMPTEAPPVVVEKPAEEIKETAPPKVIVEKPKPVDDFDVSKLKMEDVYFDFDKADLRSDTLDSLARHVETLNANPRLKVLIEGHCDERGTEEYNLALGERRATRILDYFVSAGVNKGRLKTISYGEIRPKVNEHNEGAWAQNRRAHFRLSK